MYSIFYAILTIKARHEICPRLSALQIKQFLSIYQPDETLEEPVPMSLILTIIKSPDFNHAVTKFQ